MGRLHSILILQFILLSLSAVFATALEQVPFNSDSLPTVCNLKCESDVNGSATDIFCKSHSELKIGGRCCVNKTEVGFVVLGIDLQKCGLSEETFSSSITNMSNLQFISLEGNDLKNIQSTDFHKNTDIDYLSLPPNLSCPGSNGTWLNDSSDVNSTICLFEQNACDVHNVTCPSNSHCVHSGVDLSKCLCDSGFHGYKCLEQGTFPVTSFLIGVSVPTVLLCMFLYYTQRRHVIQQQQKIK